MTAAVSRYDRAPNGGGKGEVSFASKLIDLGECRQLSANAVRMLGRVVDDEERIWKHRISSARAILMYGQWREDYEQQTPEALLRELFSDDMALLAWVEELRPKLLARLAARQLAESVVVDVER